MCIEISNNQNNFYYLSASNDKTIKIWDKFGKLKSTLESHNGPVRKKNINVVQNSNEVEKVNVLCSNKNLCFSSGSMDKSVIFWSL